MVVVSNGIDTDHFIPNSEARKRIRAEWAIDEEEVLVGLVGRLDPMKDHPTFFRAAALLASETRRIHFVCVGGGCKEYEENLLRQAEALNIRDRLIWAEPRHDMLEVFNAMDIFVSSSS